MQFQNTSRCAAILQEKLGRSYDLADPGQALKYATSGGPHACEEVISGAVLIASAIITPHR